MNTTTQPHRVVNTLPDGTALGRYIKGVASDDLYGLLARSREWSSTPHVLEALKHEKAAVPAGSTTDAVWAAPLAIHGLASEAIRLMRGLSILGAISGRFVHVPLRTKIAIETGAGISGGWVAPGAMIPVQKTNFATSIQELYKYGVIVPVSEELLRASTPSAEATIARTVLGGLAKAIDQQLLDPTITAVANTRPASITNGATAVTSTGVTQAQMLADFGALFAAVTSPGPYVLVARPATLARIALVLGQTAAGLPSSLFGIPVVSSPNSPQQVTLIDPSAILYSDAGQFDLDVSREATLILNDAPGGVVQGADGAAPPETALWPGNLAAIRAVRWLAWLRPISGSVAYMTTSY
jgi:HK97 family phage major capsid protein